MYEHITILSILPQSCKNKMLKKRLHHYFNNLHVCPSFWRPFVLNSLGICHAFIFSCRTESAAALEKTFLEGGGMWVTSQHFLVLVLFQHVASMLPALLPTCSQHVVSLLLAYCQDVVSICRVLQFNQHCPAATTEEFSVLFIKLRVQALSHFHTKVDTYLF